MSKRWTFVLHQDAFDFIGSLRPADRRKVRKALDDLTARPWQDPDAEIRPANDRSYQVRDVPGFRIVYWLDVWVCQICIVRVDRH